MKAEKLYQCEFCGKGGFNRKKMRHHEENCPLNPSSKSCQTCAYLFQELFKINPEHTMLYSAVAPCVRLEFLFLLLRKAGAS
jgi:hypothetical protein